MLAIVSNTLAIFADGANTEIELMAPFETLAYGATITPAYFTNNRILATGNFTLELPTSPADGAMANFWITGDGTAVTVTLNAGYVIPSSSSFASPFVVASGGKARLSVQYDLSRTAHEVVQFVNGY